MYIIIYLPSLIIVSKVIFVRSEIGFSSDCITTPVIIVSFVKLIFMHHLEAEYIICPLMYGLDYLKIWCKNIEKITFKVVYSNAYN